MKIDEYKQKFIELFKQMEEECGKCESVEINTIGKICNGDHEIIAKKVVCKIEF